MAEKKNMMAVYEVSRSIASQIEDNIKKGVKVPDSLIESMKAVYSDILEFAKIYLIQVNDRFWGNILMEMELEINFKQRGATDLIVKTTPFVLSINPLFCAKYKFLEFIGLIINELTKLVYLHPSVFSQINHEKDPKKHEALEKASSAASSTIVQHDIRLGAEEYGRGHTAGCRLPNDIYTRASLNKDLTVSAQENMGIEYYYNILRKFGKPPQDGGDGGQGQGQSQGSGNGNGNDPNPDLASENNQNGTATHDWEGGDSDDLKETITSMVSDAYNNLSDKSRGYMPSSIVEQIKALLEPPQIPWNQILKKMVGTVPVPYRKTRTRLNRRQPERSDLCGRLPKRTVNIVCAFDTSGSMSDEDLKYCINEVFNIVKSYEGYEITIIECDAEIQRIYTAKKMSDVQTKMRGRGGTSFIPVIEYINGTGDYGRNPKKYPKAGRYRDALLVYFTDGYGDSEIPKPKTYRNLWVVMQDEKCLSVKQPYGDVKSISTDKNWRKK